MVRRFETAEDVAVAVQRADHRFNWDELWKRHADYWLLEAVAERGRFETAAGRFHVRDDFRLVCDGQVDGHDCGNNIGLAPIPDAHDGLCEQCRWRGVDFPPRIHMTPDGIYAMTAEGPRIVMKVGG